MPAFLSAASVSATRLVRSRLVVSGNTESRVDNRKVPPSMMSASFCGPLSLRLNSFLISSSLAVSTWASAPSASASRVARLTGTVARALTDHAAVAQVGSGVRIGDEIDVLLAGRRQTRDADIAGLVESAQWI